MKDLKVKQVLKKDMKEEVIEAIENYLLPVFIHFNVLKSDEIYSVEHISELPISSEEVKDFIQSVQDYDLVLIKM